MMYVKFPLSLRNVEDLLHALGIDLCHETVRFNVERQIDETLKLDGQHFPVPSSVKGQFVVGDHVSPTFNLIEVGEPQSGNFGEADLLSRLDPATPGAEVSTSS